jgi:hypothetical protein
MRRYNMSIFSTGVKKEKCNKLEISIFIVGLERVNNEDRRNGALPFILWHESSKLLEETLCLIILDWLGKKISIYLLLIILS